MKATIRFERPYPHTPLGSGQRDYVGEFDAATGVLWVDSVRGRFGIHIASKAVIHPVVAEKPVTAPLNTQSEKRPKAKEAA